MDMKLSDFLSELGRPVAYYPGLVKVIGTTNATIFLCQFAYWRGKQQDPEGWIYKTSAEIQEETGLTYNEQTTVRSRLKILGLLEERNARIEHKMYFRIKWDVLDLNWRTWLGQFPEKGEAELGDKAVIGSLNGTSESTAESTTDKPDILDGMQHFAEVAKGKGEEEVEALLVRLEKGLYLNLPRGAGEQSIAKWILRKEKAGESLDDWLKWLKSDDWRKTHLNLYRHVSRIKTEWPQAFVKKEQSNDTSRIVDGVDEGKYV